MTWSKRYQTVQCLKQNDRETICVVKDLLCGTIYLQRVLQETTTIYDKLQHLSHPGLPRIQTVYKKDGKTIVLEEFIVGSNLSQIMQEEGWFSEQEVQRIGRQLCEILEYLHRHKIIHRDIKPENIMITKDHTVKLIDFDIARCVKKEKSSDTIYMGTKGYAPPEQYGFAQTDQRADIYALGKTMEALLGSEYRGCLRSIVLQCTELDPERRYRSVKEIARALHLSERPALYWMHRMVYKTRYGLVWAAFCVVVCSVLLPFR